jgi:hypothetical protein
VVLREQHSLSATDWHPIGTFCSHVEEYHRLSWLFGLRISGIHSYAKREMSSVKCCSLVTIAETNEYNSYEPSEAVKIP